MAQSGVVLTGEKLKVLGKLIQRQEKECSKSIPFRSEKERSEFLQCSHKNYEEAMSLIDEASKLLQSSSEDEDPGATQGVVRQYLGYMEIAAGYGFQILKGVHLRREFLRKVREHADSLILKMHELKNFRGLDTNQIEERAAYVIEQFANQKEAMYKSIIKKADPSSQHFSRAIKRSGYSFEQLVSKYQKKLVRERGSEFDDHFDFLEKEQRIEVYDEILRSSGRGSYLANKAYSVLEDVGKGLLIFTLGMSVWDVYSSEHKIQTTVSEIAEFSAGYVGGSLGEIGGAAIATYLVAQVGVPAVAVTSAFVGLTAFVTGLGIGIFFGYAAAYVVEKIFESGGKHTDGAIKMDKPQQKPPLSHAEKGHVYVAPMPDGALLARQIAYQGDQTTANST